MVIEEDISAGFFGVNNCIVPCACQYGYAACVAAETDQVVACACINCRERAGVNNYIVAAQCIDCCAAAVVGDGIILSIKTSKFVIINVSAVVGIVDSAAACCNDFFRRGNTKSGQSFACKFDAIGEHKFNRALFCGISSG